MNIEELKRLAEAALWTGRWYDGGCETLMGTYGDNSEFYESHGEIAYPFPLGIVPYLVEAQPAAILELIRQRDELLAALEKERRRLDWALKKQAYYGRSPDRLWVDVGAGNHKWFAVHNDNPRATIDELIVSAASAKAEG